jgi:hypothetical protein
MIWVLIAVAPALIWFAAFVDVVRRRDLSDSAALNDERLRGQHPF